ncbi:MAG: carotenoid oxygenase family protein [Actinomycetota bacterium]
MKTAEQVATKKAWAKVMSRPAIEFPPTQLAVKSGKIPAGLRGSLYRNGPARLQRGSDRVGHWFDGDGAILAIHFSEAIATATYRYVQTAGYQAEENAGKFLYSNYGMTAPGPLWLKWLKSVKNTANTSTIALPDRLLALWEGGFPHALDLETLETKGLDDLSGLKSGWTYSAHCKRDPHTGHLFNFGLIPGIKSKLNVYKSNATGKIIQKTTVLLDRLSLIHDFVLAGQYLVFFIPPLQVNPWPVLAGLSSYGDSLQWQPQFGTQVLVFDRDTLSLVSRGEADPWFQWHFANGYVSEEGSALVDLVRFPDFQTNQRLKEVARGATTTDAEGSLWRVSLNPETGKVTALEELCDRPCEFPTIPAAEVGQPSRYTYLAVYRPGVEIVPERYGAIARFDNQTRTLTLADCGENRYPAEPIYAPDSLNPHQGWILTVIYDGDSDESEVWIYDSNALDQEPTCRLALPQAVPLSFHGTWNPQPSR